MRTIEPSWLRVDEIRVKFGINKNFNYKKIRSKEIVSVLLSKRIRLVSVKSIEEFLASSID